MGVAIGFYSSGLELNSDHILLRPVTIDVIELRAREFSPVLHESAGPSLT